MGHQVATATALTHRGPLCEEGLSFTTSHALAAVKTVTLRRSHRPAQDEAGTAWARFISRLLFFTARRDGSPCSAIWGRREEMVCGYLTKANADRALTHGPTLFHELRTRVRVLSCWAGARPGRSGIWRSAVHLFHKLAPRAGFHILANRTCPQGTHVETAGHLQSQRGRFREPRSRGSLRSP